MAKSKKKVPGLNSSSMADISFLLLIFFLVTSSMDTDTGLTRRLPPPPQDEQNLQEMEVQRRNLMVVLVNSQNQTMVRDQLGDEWYANITEMVGRGGKVGLKDKVKEFVTNPNNNPNLPELIEQDFGEPIGTVLTTADHVISLQNDATTSYKAYIAVQNELVKAYNELREEAALKYYNKHYADLLPDQQEKINKLYPQRISEAEPKNYGGGN
ncbi:MAG: biopolymer transporter ExbD [Dysgonomonadaceae bacterium]|jgi:biopolymer transport protein ExbD|nr:biopolymer transporter ExbD [Dysgonamonadaceae bacterium]MBP9031221.1 biopolymer transporter ExbD [Dysgonamonadaceae bacterium]HRU12442.1 biopolymer transporter ExbD [Dysgonamonadaceae bacterium]